MRVSAVKRRSLILIMHSHDLRALYIVHDYIRLHVRHYITQNLQFSYMFCGLQIFFIILKSEIL